jgi:hypothetical protein
MLRLYGPLHAELRQDVLAGLGATGTTLDQRVRSVQRTQAATRRCPVAVELLRRQLGKRLAPVRASAVHARLAKPFPAEVWFVGNEDWVVQPRDGRWTITAMNALADALSGVR